MSPRAITPWKRGPVFWARVPRLEQGAVQRSLGTTDRSVAVEMCRFLEWLRGRREAWLLEQLASGSTTVGEAFDAYRANRLERFIIELRDGAADPDLEPYVEAWQRELRRTGRPNADTARKYLTQVRTLLEEGQRFPRSQFTKQRVREWLDGRGVDQPNRYRAALSSFAEYLLFEDVIGVNPVRQVKMARESEPRTKHLTQGQAIRLVNAFVDPRMRALHATMLATGMEISAAVRLDRETVTESSVYADGRKTAHRKRTATVPPRWAWAWAIARAFIAEASSGRPFSGIVTQESNNALRGALRAAKLDPAYTQHDHRHTWAVQAIRDGIAPHVIAYQLGHRDAVMLSRVYGRFRPDASDYGVNTPSSATVDPEKEPAR